MYEDEIWVYTVDHDPRYQVSNYGRIKNIDGTIKKLQLVQDKDGNSTYYQFMMQYENGKAKHEKVNRIVIYYFYPDQNTMADYFFDKNYIVEHMDQNKLNNHINNLRFATHSQNGGNIKQTKGYHWHKNAKKYMAQIMVNRKHIYLGLYNNKKYAKFAYQTASIKYFGEFSPWYLSGPDKIKVNIKRKE